MQTVVEDGGALVGPEVVAPVAHVAGEPAGPVGALVERVAVHRHARRVALVAVDDAGPGGVEVVAPREDAGVGAAGGFFSLQLVGQAVRQARALGQPAGVGACAEPVDQHHRPVRLPELAGRAPGEREAPGALAPVDQAAGLGHRSAELRAGGQGLFFAPLVEQRVEKFQKLGVGDRVAAEGKAVDPDAAARQAIHGQRVAAGPAPAGRHVDLVVAQPLGRRQRDREGQGVARSAGVPVAIALDQDGVAHDGAPGGGDAQHVGAALQG